ncbi:MAG: hypothetical protein ACLFQV_04650 [Vulcanimicrobiota bacterium]
MDLIQDNYIEKGMRRMTAMVKENSFLSKKWKPSASKISTRKDRMRRTMKWVNEAKEIEEYILKTKRVNLSK